MATSDEGLIDFKSRVREMSDTIIQSLHLADILDGMVSYCALTVDDRAFIDAQPTLARKNRMFLEVILSRGDIACEVFIDLLREDGHYDNLVERLCQSVTGYDECDWQGTCEEDMVDDIIPEYKVKLQKNYKKIANVKFQYLFDFLLAKDVISFIEYEEIKTEPILPDQNRRLLDILMLKGENAYQHFLDTLRLGDKCVSIVEDIESTKVTKEEQKRLAAILSENTDQQVVRLSKRLEEIAKENERLKVEVLTLKDPIPPNIREKFKECIKDWKIEEERYIVTRATKHVQQLIPSVNCVVVTGSSGNGKSALIHHVALQMQTQGKFEIIPFVDDLSDILRYSDPQKNQVFVIDDICGKVTVNVQIVDWWFTHLDRIEKLLTKGNVKLLASCRLLIYNDPQFARLKHLFTHECNLLSTKFSVLHEERLLIANKYLAKNVIKYIKDLIDIYDFFPLLCKLYSKRSNVDARQFFMQPIDGIRHDLEIIQQCNKVQYCAIIMVILLNNRFKYEWLKPTSRPADIALVIQDICNECVVDLRTQSARKEFKQQLDALLLTYIKKSDNCYRMIHDKIYDIAAVVCGQHLSECFIKHADSTFIGDRFRFESVNEADGTCSSDDDDSVDGDNAIPKKSEENVIFIPCDEEELYFDRLIEDLKKGITYSAFHNKQLQCNLYRSKFIEYCKNRQQIIEKLLRQIEEEGQALSVRTYKEDDFRSIRLPLIESVFEGYEDLVEMLLDFKCDLNLCDKYGRSALYVASTLGYTPVVKLLLQNGADTSKITWLCQSALYAACEGGHSDIVDLLLDKKANTANCDIAGRTPFYIACHEGHTHIVRHLLKRKNVFACDKAGRSPFFVACSGGHFDVVKLLLQTNFDIYKSADNRFTPLHIACQGGHAKVVKLLLTNNFDIRLGDSNSRTALHIACEGGHTDVVKLLLKNKASVYHCDSGGRSPLYTACEGGHTSVVKLLLDNNANVGQCDNFGRSPLYAACGWEHAEVVKLLLETGEDLSQCDKRGYSALHVACFTGHVESVTLLIKHNFPLSQGDESGQTPLILASKAGHKEVVHVLLNNKANVSECDNNGRSPLYVASREGRLEIVKLLLENNANSSVADKDGLSPLQMALKGKHTEVVSLLLKDNPTLYVEQAPINETHYRKS